MKRLELRTDNTAPSSSPVKLGLAVLIAVIFVALVAPFAMRQMKTVLFEPTQATPPPESEPWPTPPATYAPPTVVAAASLRTDPTPTPLPTAIPAPVWRELNYLTTVEFTTSSVVTTQRTANLELGGVRLMDNLVTDRLLLKAVGRVQLGVNLGQVSQVKVTGKKISLRLPIPEVTSVELLPEQSQIFDSVQVWFLSQYKGMETEALQQARKQLGDEVADNPSMMEMASEMARLQLTEFLRKTGFETVEITFQEPQR
ncbi:MAG: DUF4230 domain-containing protein [Chloroflexi bacterium]|nr:DUF4230 domain-containing protein [Chloroflexota bacterium]